MSSSVAPYRRRCPRIIQHKFILITVVLSVVSILAIAIKDILLVVRDSILPRIVGSHVRKDAGSSLSTSAGLPVPRISMIHRNINRSSDKQKRKSTNGLKLLFSVLEPCIAIKKKEKALGNPGFRKLYYIFHVGDKTFRVLSYHFRTVHFS
jgi:hypothetical protein